MNDSYGNFIIQKLLCLLNNNDKLILLNEIERVIPSLDKKHIQVKWKEIVSQHRFSVGQTLNINDTIKNIEPAKKIKSSKYDSLNCANKIYNRDDLMNLNRRDVPRNLFEAQAKPVHLNQYNARPYIITPHEDSKYSQGCFYLHNGQHIFMSNPYRGSYVQTKPFNSMSVPVIVSVPAFIK